MRRVAALCFYLLIVGFAALQASPGSRFPTTLAQFALVPEMVRFGAYPLGLRSDDPPMYAFQLALQRQTFGPTDIPWMETERFVHLQQVAGNGRVFSAGVLSDRMLSEGQEVPLTPSLVATFSDRHANAHGWVTSGETATQYGLSLWAPLSWWMEVGLWADRYWLTGVPLRLIGNRTDVATSVAMATIPGVGVNTDRGGFRVGVGTTRVDSSTVDGPREPESGYSAVMAASASKMVRSEAWAAIGSWHISADGWLATGAGQLSVGDQDEALPFGLVDVGGAQASRMAATISWRDLVAVHGYVQGITADRASGRLDLTSAVSLFGDLLLKDYMLESLDFVARERGVGLAGHVGLDRISATTSVTFVDYLVDGRAELTYEEGVLFKRTERQTFGTDDFDDYLLLISGRTEIKVLPSLAVSAQAETLIPVDFDYFKGKTPGQVVDDAVETAQDQRNLRITVSAVFSAPITVPIAGN